MVAPSQPHWLEAAQFYRSFAKLLHIRVQAAQNTWLAYLRKNVLSPLSREEKLGLEYEEKVCTTMKLALTWISSALIPSSK